MAASLVRQTTKLDTGMVQCRLFSPGSACPNLMAIYVSGGFEETACHLLAIDIGIEALHLVWWFGQPLGTLQSYLFFGSMVIWMQVDTFLASYIQWLRPTLEARKMSSANKVMQNHMLHILSWPTSIYRVFDCCPDLHVFCCMLSEKNSIFSKFHKYWFIFIITFIYNTFRQS